SESKLKSNCPGEYIDFMRRFITGITLAVFLGLSPVAAYCACGHDHSAKKHANHGEHGHKGKHADSQCDSGTCPFKHKNKKQKETAENCSADDQHCLEETAEYRNEKPAVFGRDLLALVSWPVKEVAFPVVAFLA